MVLVLDDYAEAAAAEMTQRAALYLDYQVRSAAAQMGFFLARRHAGEPLPTPRDLRTGGNARDADRRGWVRAVFRLGAGGRRRSSPVG